MRADHAGDQGRDNGGSPGRQLTSFKMHMDLPMQICQRAAQVGLAGGETAIHSNGALVAEGRLLKRTRPEIESDVNFLHADVSSFNRYWKSRWKSRASYPCGDICWT